MDKVKITRKDLKQPDEFVLFTTKAYQWAVLHQMQIFYGLLAVFAGIIVAVLLQSWHSSRDSKAANMLYEADSIVLELRTNKATDQAVAADLTKKALDAYDRLINVYPSSGPAKVALLEKGNFFFEEGKYKEALGCYEKLSGAFSDDDMAKASVLTAIGYAKEGTQDLKGALESFKKASTINLAPRKDMIYYKIAKIDAKLGNKEEAVKYFNMINSDYPQSKLAAKVGMELAEVK